MRPELQAIVDEFDTATARLRALARPCSRHAQWSRRPSPERWSASACVAHLNLASQAFLQLLRPAWFLRVTHGPPMAG